MNNRALVYAPWIAFSLSTANGQTSLSAVRFILIILFRDTANNFLNIAELFTAPFDNMRTMKYKTQLTIENSEHMHLE